MRYINLRFTYLLTYTAARDQYTFRLGYASREI